MVLAIVGRASGCFPDVQRDVFLKLCCRKTNYHMKGCQCQEREGEWHALTVFNHSLFLFLYSEKVEAYADQESSSVLNLQLYMSSSGEFSSNGFKEVVHKQS